MVPFNANNFLPNPHNRRPTAGPWERDMGCILWVWNLMYVLLLHFYKWYHHTVKPACNDHLSDKINYLRFIHWCVLMKTEGTNRLLLTISAFWSSSRWPLATWMSFRRQRSIPLGGRYRQVSLYITRGYSGTQLCYWSLNATILFTLNIRIPILWMKMGVL